MLYLHCGWPRTATTSLQTALYELRDRLMDSGLLYPDEWRSRTDFTHHGLPALLRASRDSEYALDDFKRFLEAHADGDVVLSSEGLTTWLGSEWQQEALVNLLSVAREVMPTRCFWTLRRHDQFLTSWALLKLKMRTEDIAPDRGPPRPPGADRLACKFAGMRRVEQALDGDVVYVKYDPSGEHNLELLRAFGLSGDLLVEIREALESGPRRHPSLSLKEAVVLLNVEALSARAGTAFDRATLKGVFMRSGFRRGEFRFTDDRRCDLIDSNLRQAMHEQALEAARRQGVTSYVEFFADAEIEQSVTVDLDPGIITDEDLERLVAELSAGEPGGVDRVVTDGQPSSAQQL